VGRDGTSAPALVQAAREEGLVARTFSVGVAGVSELVAPAILYWDFNHYVVLESWSGAGAEIVDPASGRRRLKPREFDRHFTGIALTFEPGPEFSTRGRQVNYWRPYVRRLLNARGAYRFLGQVLAASLVLQALGLVVPLLTKVLVDFVIPGRLESILPAIGICAILMMFGQSALAYMRSVVLIHLRARLDIHVMAGFVEHLLSLPVSFFLQRTVGDLLVRLGSNAMLRELVAMQTMSALLDGSYVAVYLCLLFATMPSLALVIVAVCVVQVAIVLGSRRRLRELVQRDLYARTQEQGCLVEMIKGILMLKASGSEHHAYERWANFFTGQLNIGIERSELGARLDAAVLLLRSVCPVLMLWIGAAAVLQHRAEIGTILACVSLSSAALLPMITLMGSIQQFQMAAANIERVADVMDAHPEQAPAAGLAHPELSGAITLDRVGFRYTETSRRVLQDISCSIRKGEKIAIVGSTGSGKSTLAMLLLGLYAPSEGDIFYDGWNLKELDYHALRQRFGLVLQDAPVFQGSIRMNIAFHNPAMPDGKVVAAARAAHLNDEIQQMPMGYETVVAEGGVNLSGGQRQRLAIARALATDPAILLLDEATSNIDERTERSINRTLAGLNCTRIVVSHRLSTIQDADQILVLENGRLVEHGRHDQLLSLNGAYSRLNSETLRQMKGESAVGVDGGC
jgi:ABC-type bacteriocin/lantibiotic exporter with double-glycine peptidase domain